MILLRISLGLVIIGITYLSLTPTTSVSVGNDKVGHFIAYAVLMTHLGLLFLDKKKAVPVLLALFYGAFMEFGQYFVPGRIVSIYDMAANAIGVLIGWGIVTLFGHKIKKRLIGK